MSTREKGGGAGRERGVCPCAENWRGGGVRLERLQKGKHCFVHSKPNAKRTGTNFFELEESKAPIRSK